jgi:hypothetical protein
VVKHLLCKHEALSSHLDSTKKKKKKKKLKKPLLPPNLNLLRCDYRHEPQAPATYNTFINRGGVSF